MKNLPSELKFFFKFWWTAIKMSFQTSTNNTPTIPEDVVTDELPTDVYEMTQNEINEQQQIKEEEAMIENGKKNVMICLDNGHGEETPGKRSPWSACKKPPELPFREYAYCREIVSRLAKVLHEDGYSVEVIVPEEWDVKLSERGNRINKIVAEARKAGMRTLSISIHNNAAGKGDAWKEAYGWSVWTTRGQNNSDKLATCLFEAAEEVLTPLGQKTRKDTSDGDPDYEDNFAMCRMPNCPAVLTENMFQDCIKEVEFLLTEEGKNAIVEIHRRGIEKFIELMNW